MTDRASFEQSSPTSRPLCTAETSIPTVETSMSTAEANGAPKKPKAPMDYYVLECFKKMNQDDDLIDLGELPESRLRTVLRLVSADSTFGDGMDRGELLGAAGELLAVEGNDIRFKKSLVQIEAKAKWQGMTPNERRPYEAKSEADKEAWDAYHGVSKPKVEPAPQASGSGGAAESSKASEKPKPKPKEKKEVKSGPSASGDAGANALINPPKKPSHKKKEPSDDAPANIKKPKTEKAAAAAPKKKDNSGSGEKRKRIEQEPDTDEEDGGAAGASNPNASKGGVTVEEVACPELGVGWKCVSKKRGQGSGAKQVDKTYVSPDGKSFNSRIKVCTRPFPPFAILPALI